MPENTTGNVAIPALMKLIKLELPGDQFKIEKFPRLIIMPERIMDKKFDELGPAYFGALVEKKEGIARIYKNGCICFNPSRAKAFALHGAIYQKWLQLGGLAFAMPNTDETATADKIGWFNHFNNNTASIYWTPQTGANAVYGAIRDKWVSLGAERSFLGYPTTDELSLPGGRYSNFQTGQITWSPALGAGISYTTVDFAKSKNNGGGFSTKGTGWEPQPEIRRRIVLTAHMNITDHETVFKNQHGNQSQSVEHVISSIAPRFIMSLHGYAGGEVRVELKLFASVTTDGGALISGQALLFEGDSLNTTDLDGAITILLKAPRDEYSSHAFEVSNTDEGDDFANIVINITNYAI